MSYPGSGDPSQRAFGQHGARPNPSDRVIPPPGYSPDAAAQGADGSPSPSGLPRRPPRAAARPHADAQSAGFGGVPFPSALPSGPPPQPPRGGNGGLWIVLAVLVAVALILGGVFVWLTVRGDTRAVPSASPVPSSSTGGPDAGVTTLPVGARTCPATVASSSGLRGSAVGSAATSCPFAEEVRLAYTRGGSDRNSRTVVASSPVTGKRYEMTCVSSARLVTCSGGQNAVVYLF